MDLHSKLLADFLDRSLYQQAEEYGINYLEQAASRHVFPQEDAIENLTKFEEELPEEIGNAKDIIHLLNNYGAPATSTIVGGRYFGFVNGGVIPAALAAKNLSIFWDQNSAMQVISPIASKLESVVQKWLIDLFGLPTETVAGFVSGTMMANFCALAAARYRILHNQGWDVTEKGLFGAPQIRVVTCREAHSTILKSISLMGLGKGNIEWVDVDEQGRIIPENIPELDNRSILILQAGNVNSGAFDNYSQICKKAKSQGAWIHIDGAFGLWAAGTRRLNHLTKDFDQADSWAVDGHKTLNTPYDSGIILCRDQSALTSALHMKGDYIIIGKERDGMYYTPEMSRRARVIELWAALKYLGRQGVDQLVSGMHDRALQFAQEITKIDGFVVPNDVVFNQVMVKCSTDQITNKVLQHVQNQRVCWVGGSQWKNSSVIRVSICSWMTTEKDVNLTVESFRSALLDII